MSSAASVTPTDVLARRRRVILDGDADGFADLFAPDGVIEMPFAGTLDVPTRIEGREAIRAYARQMMASPLRLEEFEVVALHQTLHPEVVVAEMRTSVTVATTGRSASVASVQILQITDGLIRLLRNFADPRVLVDVVGERHPTD